MDTDDFRADAGDDLILVKRLFRITKCRDDILTTAAIRDICPLHNLSWRTVKDRLIRMGAVFDKNCRVNGVALGTGLRCVQHVANAET
jgi:hypothetical protein